MGIRVGLYGILGRLQLNRNFPLTMNRGTIKSDCSWQIGGASRLLLLPGSFVNTNNSIVLVVWLVSDKCEKCKALLGLLMPHVHYIALHCCSSQQTQLTCNLENNEKKSGPFSLKMCSSSGAKSLKCLLFYGENSLWPYVAFRALQKLEPECFRKKKLFKWTYS